LTTLMRPSHPVRHLAIAEADEAVLDLMSALRRIAEQKLPR